MVKQLPLSNGAFAPVDDEEYDRALAAGPWHAKRSHRAVYAHRNVRRADGTWTTQTLHAFITGSIHIDHRNGNGLDNQRANLRECTNRQNAANARVRADSRSGYKGVGFSHASRRWRARIMRDGKSRWLGLFDTPEAAALAYDAAAAELFGEFARPNFPVEIAS